MAEKGGLRGGVHRPFAANADPAPLAGAGLVAVYVGMHTATRIAVEAIPRIKALAPAAHLCVYGLYAPMNETL
jgi:hypothetical protein